MFENGLEKSFNWEENVLKIMYIFQKDSRLVHYYASFILGIVKTRSKSTRSRPALRGCFNASIGSV